MDHWEGGSKKLVNDSVSRVGINKEREDRVDEKVFILYVIQ